MLNFYFHPVFKKETAKLQRRFNHLKDGLKSFERLCEVQFHPINPQQIIAPAKLHRVTSNDMWSMWKVELIVKNLRPNQFPRLWFAVKGANVVFLYICTHIDNYKDNEINRIAIERVSGIF